MQDTTQDVKAFGTFRALEGNGDAAEREQLFRNVARLFSYVCMKCDDDQVEQYDEVLCQLAELVEVEGRSEVAKVLSTLERAPGTVVVKLANDAIEVAQPLLEFSSVLSDDDLIEIVGAKSEAHREIIAGRSTVAERVGDAIVVHGGAKSVTRLVANQNAQLGDETLAKLVEKAAQDCDIAQNLRGRSGLNWEKLQAKIDEASETVVEKLTDAGLQSDEKTIEQVNAVVFNRIQNRAGFSGANWRIAWNQVKALGDRKQLNPQSLVRFSRFGYGHHFGAAMACMLNLKPAVFVKWLAKQDYRALIVGAKTLGLSPDVFEQGMMILPWREFPTVDEIKESKVRFEGLSEVDAANILDVWCRNEAKGKGEPRSEEMVLVG
ncbi:MAG: DUF2336 domain-containing protein [Devosiaceae bacterium]|nr:DUF2336 domain-containing protein [Devosiaceae bacterium]